MPTLRSAETGEILVPTLRILEGIFARGIGLLGRRGLPEGEAWLFPRCSAIHTFGMRFRLDLVFLDRNSRVVRTVANVGPWQAVTCRHAAAVIEAASDWLTLPAEGTELRVGIDNKAGA